jgi:hypothetical protein
MNTALRGLSDSVFMDPDFYQDDGEVARACA